MDKVNLFISYAHKDEEGLKDFFVYINEMTCANINLWYDEKIALGQEWNDAIKENLNDADIVVLLLSQPFLNSPYIKNNEVSRAIERHKNNEAVVVPIFYRYCRPEKYPQEILDLQGFPNPEEPLFEADKKKDRLYAYLQQKLEDLAGDLIKKRRISQNLIRPTDSNLGQKALKIQHLSNSKNIFLSIPSSARGFELRKNFINDIERKIKYETPDWPYRLCPTTGEASAFLQANEDDQQAMLAQWMAGCIYDIHLVGTPADLKSESFEQQYQLAKKTFEQTFDVTSTNEKGAQEKEIRQHHTILWFVDPGMQDTMKVLEPSFLLDLKMLPMVLGNDVSAIFKQIESFDHVKQKRINALSSSFSQLKKIFMFYDYDKDYKNELRKMLRRKIQENKEFAIRDPAVIRNESNESLLKEFAECQGAVIFYGPDCDGLWYREKEKMILRATNIKARAVCVDGKAEPDIEEKVDLDVSVNEIIPIKGLPELEPGLTKFKIVLQENSK